MKFYLLDDFPHGPAETCMSEAKGSQQGNAPKCGAYVGSLLWLPPLTVELELVGKQLIENGSERFTARAVNRSDPFLFPDQTSAR
jgi:hypothetical protein